MTKIKFGFTYEALVFAALYVSEVWYSSWNSTTSKKSKLYYKTRAIVVYDRVLNTDISTEGAIAELENTFKL